MTTPTTYYLQLLNYPIIINLHTFLHCFHSPLFLEAQLSIAVLSTVVNSSYQSIRDSSLADKVELASWWINNFLQYPSHTCCGWCHYDLQLVWN